MGGIQMVKNTSLKEFLPERPVMFDPPKLMYVWNGFDDVDSPMLADVAYVNPSLSVNRVLALGMNVSARNMGTTWNHCAECCTTLDEENREHLVQGIKEYRQASGEQSRIGATKLTGEMATHKELSRWLSDGNGQVMVARKMDGITPLQWGTSFSYTIDRDDVSVPCEGGVGVGEQYVKVRKYGDTKSADPTREYLGIIEDKKVELATYCNVVRWLSDHLRNMADATVSYCLDEVWITGKDGNTIKLTPAEVDYRKYTDQMSVIPSNMYTVSAMLTGCLLYDPVIRMDEYELVMNRVGYLDYLAGVLNNSTGKPSCSTVDWNSYVAKRINDAR
jgi:hypothetical protein